MSIEGSKSLHDRESALEADFIRKAEAEAMRKAKQHLAEAVASDPAFGALREREEKALREALGTTGKSLSAGDVAKLLKWKHGGDGH